MWFDKPLALTNSNADALLLPGDTQQILLQDAQQVDVLQYAQDECSGYLCQLLPVPGKPSEYNSCQRVYRWMPLLQVMETREQSPNGGTAPSHLMWTELRCVGRVRLPVASGGLLDISTAPGGHGLPFRASKVGTLIVERCLLLSFSLSL